MNRNERRLLTGDSVIDITPEVVAELFADMNSEEQARFFNHVAAVASTWTGMFEMQLQHITDDDGLTLAGRRVMQAIGDYSHWGLVPKARTAP